MRHLLPLRGIPFAMGLKINVEFGLRVEWLGYISWL
jgi:hypothetical protein